MVIKINNKTMTINGKDMKLIKLLDNEILIKGITNNIEFR